MRFTVAVAAAVTILAAPGPIEEAQAYKRLLTEFNLKQDEVAERVSKSRTAVTNAMRLLKLNEKVQQMLIDDMLTTGHARALLAIEDQDKQYEIGNIAWQSIYAMANILSTITTITIFISFLFCSKVTPNTCLVSNSSGT